MVAPRFVLAGTGSGCGKTTLSLGLMRAFACRGKVVQPFKAGPDYIDPLYHTQAAGRVSRNLDSWLLLPEALKYLFLRQAASASISLIEGVMGYYDGFGSTTHGSTYETASILQAPVVLVLPCKGMSYSLCAMAKGFAELLPHSRIAGLLLNHMRAGDFYEQTKRLLQEQTGLPVVGHVPPMPEVQLESRHLGLKSQLPQQLEEQLERLADTLLQTVDFDLLEQIAGAAPELSHAFVPPAATGQHAKIAVAKDNAFHFYYQDNLDLLEELGLAPVFFSPIADAALPAGVSGLYLGGGYPEVFAAELAANTSMRESIGNAAKDGMPILAECGGLMYLTSGLRSEDSFAPFAGVLAGECNMTTRLGPFGYVEVEAAADTLLLPKGARVRGHEFHYSRTESPLEPALLAHKQRGSKELVWAAGYQQNNTLAGYPHLHFYAKPEMAQRFARHIFDYQSKKRSSGV